MSTVPKRLLIVDDDPGVVDYLVEMLEHQGYTVQGLTSPQRALDQIAEDRFDLVITDVEMPGMRGLDLMAAIHARHPNQLVLLITAFGSIDLAVQSVRAGACDFVTKPFPIEELYTAIERAFRDRQMRRTVVRLREPKPDPGSYGLVTRNPKMQRVMELARRAALTDCTVLLTGESGVGKSALAHFIREQSQRRARPFVQINCAALPASLVESELFGVRKGAYTDAREDRPGLFVQAHGGTLFLDEVAEMPLETQPKLLQALETGKMRAVGGNQEIAVDVRVLAATNQPPEKAVHARLLRADLYHRLNVIRFEIPPLRERPEDIEVLVDDLLQRASAKLKRTIVGLSVEAMRWIRAYPWPGNVRELANTIERAVALTDHDTILLEDLALASHLHEEDDFLRDAVARGLSLAEVEHTYIRLVLEAANGNKVQAASILGIDRGTLYRKLGTVRN
jgi:DNA-binding NtrC family response regulator